MNRLLAFLIFIFLSLASSRSFAEWIEINKSVSGNTFYMDTAKIKKNNGKVYYWTIQDYLKPADGIFSGKSYIEATCKTPLKQRYLAVTLYAGPMATGQSFSVSAKEIEAVGWRTPHSGSAEEGNQKYACKFN